MATTAVGESFLLPPGPHSAGDVVRIGADFEYKGPLQPERLWSIAYFRDANGVYLPESQFELSFAETLGVTGKHIQYISTPFTITAGTAFVDFWLWQTTGRIPKAQEPEHLVESTAELV